MTACSVQPAGLPYQAIRPTRSKRPVLDNVVCFGIPHEESDISDQECLLQEPEFIAQ